MLRSGLAEVLERASVLPRGFELPALRSLTEASHALSGSSYMTAFASAVETRHRIDHLFTTPQWSHVLDTGAFGLKTSDLIGLTGVAEDLRRSRSSTEVSSKEPKGSRTRPRSLGSSGEFRRRDRACQGGTTHPQ